VPVGHPNDLFAGEAATFRVLVDGKPVAGPGDSRSSAAARAIATRRKRSRSTTDAKGEFSVTWPEAGMYWLESRRRQDDKTSVPQARQRRLSYVATLEVLPQ
jgi:uncharacterized GH25 family protein